MARKEVRQRMIYMCDLPIGTGSEFSGIHPCLIASIDIRNDSSPNVYIFPITHATRKWQPTHFILLKDDYEFFKHINNTVLCESGREISRSRLQGYMGEISIKDFEEILKLKDYVFKEYSY